MALRPGYILITKDHIGTLKSHRKRTGVSEYALLSYSDPVHWVTVSGWISGGVKSAKPDNIDFVLKKWADLPDNKKGFIELTDELRAKIREAIGSRNRRILFGTRNDLPKGFNSQLLGRMTAHKPTSQKHVKKEYVDYVFKVCGE